MKRFATGVSFGLILVSLFCARTDAATITAASCSQADVETTLNSAAAGDTILIPAGTCTWTRTTTWNAPANVTVMGAGNQSVMGGGDKTVIIDNLDRTSSDRGMLNISTNSSGTFRLSGITFRWGGVYRWGWDGTLRISGSSEQVRVDHCHFEFPNAASMTTYNVYGVIDHSVFDNCYIASVYHSQLGGVGNYGDASWASDTDLGTYRFMFMEDNVVTRHSADILSANDSTSGGRWVARYNTFNNTRVQTHPTGGGQRYRGSRAWEIYGNTYINGLGSTLYDGFWLSSGTGVIWGNHGATVSTPITGYRYLVSLHLMRSDPSSGYAQTGTPNGWGYCGTSYDGIGSKWDQNTNLSIGYACLDQPGRGKGDLLSGAFPNAINTVTGMIAWPRQALEPIYVWSNLFTAPTDGTVVGNTAPAVFVSNRDYYLDTAGFNGTSGVGSGALAARPTTCTPKVAYWATDTNTLYQCSATNTWVVYYKPYTYPHPLTQVKGTVSVPPAPTLLGVR